MKLGQRYCGLRVRGSWTATKTLFTSTWADITVRFLSEDVPDSTEENVRLALSHIGKVPSVMEEVELQKVGYLTWASDRFVDL